MTQYNYIFLIRLEQELDDLLIARPIIDSFLEIPNKDVQEYYMLKETFNKTMSKYVAAINSLKLRIRYNNNIIPHILKVNTEFKLTAEDLETYIKYLNKEELSKFIKEAKI